MPSCRVPGSLTTTSKAASEPRHREKPEPLAWMRPRNRLACGWALVVLVGVVINLVVLVVTPVLRPELNLLEKSLSYYAVGPWGAIQAAAFLAPGISSMALGVALLGAHIPSPWMWLIVLLLIISAWPVWGSSGIQWTHRGQRRSWAMPIRPRARSAA